jgi:hypothetical protein
MTKAQRQSLSQRSVPGMIDGDCSSNSRSRSICILRLAGSSRSSFRDARSLSPISWMIARQCLWSISMRFRITKPSFCEKFTQPNIDVDYVSHFPLRRSPPSPSQHEHSARAEMLACSGPRDLAYQAAFLFLGRREFVLSRREFASNAISSIKRAASGSLVCSSSARYRASCSLRSSPSSSSFRKYSNPALCKASGLFSPASYKLETYRCNVVRRSSSSLTSLCDSKYVRQAEALATSAA